MPRSSTAASQDALANEFDFIVGFIQCQHAFLQRQMSIASSSSSSFGTAEGYALRDPLVRQWDGCMDEQQVSFDAAALRDPFFEQWEGYTDDFPVLFFDSGIPGDGNIPGNGAIGHLCLEQWETHAEEQQFAARDCNAHSLEESDWCMAEQQLSARSCAVDALAASLACVPEAQKAPSESDQSTRSPTTEDSPEIDDEIAREVISPEIEETASTDEPAIVSSYLDAAMHLHSWADEPDESAWSIPVLKNTKTSPPVSGPPPSPPRQVPQGSRSSSTPKSLVLRGLPFNCTEADIRSFIKLAGLGPDDLARDSGIVLLTNAQGRPSGFAEIHLNRAVEFREMHERLHMKRIGTRYIEVLAPRQVRNKRGGGGPRGGQKSWRRA